MSKRILVVDDEASMRRMLEILFSQEKYEVECAKSAEEALSALDKAPFDLVLSDVRMPGLSGLDLLRRLKEEDSSADVILMTAYASTESAIKALKLGAFDYVTKPFQVDELMNIVRHSFEKKTLLEENLRLRRELARRNQYGEIIGGAPSMKELYALIDRIASTTSNVLIEGESGSGKELIAKTLHQKSTRARNPFVPVNCGALPETLLESELFGHVKGAFTGAHTAKKGLMESAGGGTLFLDEIGEMSQPMQVKLLRALQDRKIRPVGGNEERSIDIRIITATNRELKQLVKEKVFREDLYYRINVISILVPPLRDRVEDIPLLAHHFMEKYGRILGKPVPKLTNEALKTLEAYKWPGNVRQLENVIERAMTLITGDSLDVSLLTDEIRQVRTLNSGYNLTIPESGFSLNDTVEDLRAAYVKKAIDLENGVMSRAAVRLGISFRSIRYLVKKYRLKVRAQDT